MPAIKIPTEHDEQVRLVRWMRSAHPEHRIFAIPNGGLRNKGTAIKLKAEGCVAGIPDLMIPSLNLWIEMKRTKGGVTSPEQKDWIAYLQSIGHHAEVCKGAEDAKATIIKYL